jgi:hypothetical protein
VVFAKQSVSNIVVTVELRDDDSGPEVMGLPVIFSTWQLTPYSSKANTSTTYRERR